MKNKKLFALTLLISVFLLTGCQKKLTGTVSDLKKGVPDTETEQESIGLGEEASIDGVLQTFKSSQLGVIFQHPNALNVYDCGNTLRLSFAKYDNSICSEGPKDSLPPITIGLVHGGIDSAISWHENQLNVTLKEMVTGIEGVGGTRLEGTWKTGGMRPELAGTKYEAAFLSTGPDQYKFDLSYLDVSKEGGSEAKYKQAFDQILESLKIGD